MFRLVHFYAEIVSHGSESLPISSSVASVFFEGSGSAIFQCCELRAAFD